MNIRVVPVTFRQARDFVTRHHRHHGPPQGMKFVVGVADDDQLVAVAIVGRPIARHLDDGVTLEVTRTCADGTRNANSMLYGAGWRAARALGYHRLVTYTQDEEGGGSIRAAGFRLAAAVRPHSGWNRTGRPRRTQPATTRIRWEITSSQWGSSRRAESTLPSKLNPMADDRRDACDLRRRRAERTDGIST